jgi:PPE-repeat protein
LVMSYPTLPPEVNSALMHAGAGSEPMRAAASAWTGLANELRAAACSFGSVTSGLAGSAWQGPSAKAMTEAAAPYAAWLGTAACHSEQAATQATAVASAFEAARSATVPPALIAANRAVTNALASTNLFGLNFPAIAQKESEYAEMWAQDVTAMFGYHSNASTAVSQLGPLQQLMGCLPGMPKPGTPPTGTPPSGTGPVKAPPTGPGPVLPRPVKAPPTGPGPVKLPPIRGISAPEPIRAAPVGTGPVEIVD